MPVHGSSKGKCVLVSEEHDHKVKCGQLRFPEFQYSCSPLAGKYQITKTIIYYNINICTREVYNISKFRLNK